MRNTHTATILALALVPARPASSFGAIDDALTPAIRSSVIENVRARLNSTYVDADVATLIAKALQVAEAGHAYDALTNPAQFAEMVTRDLRSVNGDLHLGLRYSKEPLSAAVRGGSPFGDPRLLNFGMGRAEILDGNIGYLEITGFTGGDYQEAVVDALRFLSRTDAVILDVRRNGGGASDMSHFIFSHFLGDKPVPTINVRTRTSPEPNRRMSLGPVPGPRRPDVPLFVLVSQGTASAAEEFCFVLKNQRRATLVGRRTAGAGHMVAQIPLGEGFTVSLSITRVSDPATGLEWEQVGVMPDVPVSPESALEVAHAAALKLIAGKTTEAGRSELLYRLLETVEARGRAVAPADAQRAARFEGTYEGRTVSVRDGRLWYKRRLGGLSEPLTALSAFTYALGAVRFRFAESAGAITLTVEQTDGTKIALTRTALASEKPEKP